MFGRSKAQARPGCFRMSITYVHQGPVTARGVARVGEQVVNRYVCERCGSELFALDPYVDAINKGADPVALALSGVHLPDVPVSGRSSSGE